MVPNWLVPTIATPGPFHFIFDRANLGKAKFTGANI